MSMCRNIRTGLGFASLAVLLLSGWDGTLRAAEPEKADKADKAAAPSPAAPLAGAPRYTLGQCIALGMERQPTLKAARAIVQAAEQSRRGLDELGTIASILTPSLKYRREQSCNGLEAARAELSGAEQEITYAIVRTYYLTVYAREQYAIVNDLIVQLKVYYDQVKTAVNSKNGPPEGIDKNTQDRLALAINAAVIRRNEAESGIMSAKAALREAMGIEPSEAFEITDTNLWEIEAAIDRDSVIALAVARRAETRLSTLGADVARLEILAQFAERFRKKMPTYAIGSDLHAIPVPLGSREKDYRPEAIGPRMPAQIVGDRDTRSAQAASYAAYAEALKDKTRNLITLEAENGYQKYKQATRNIETTREARKLSKELIKRLRDQNGNKLDVSLMLTSEGTATFSDAQYNEALIEQITALANIERITAGGIRVNYPGR